MIVKIFNKWIWGSTIEFICDGVGVCNVEFLDTTTWGYINGLTVSDEERRKGIGTRLMNEAESSIKNAGFNESRLDVEVTREWQFKWYKRIGYEVYHQDETLYYMKKELS